MKNIILGLFILSFIGLVLIPLVQAHPYTYNTEDLSEEEFIEHCVEVMGEGDVEVMLEECSEIYDTEFESVEEMLEECNQMSHMKAYCHKAIGGNSNNYGMSMMHRNNRGYCH